MKKNLILLSLILFIGKIYGQGNYRRGYIITNENDTIAGWIDYRTNVQNMSVCKFKTDESEETISYLPGEIFGYRLDEVGKFYVSKDITINGESRTVFLEYLVQGIMNLYHYIDYSFYEQNMAYYFFEDETGKMTPVTKNPDKYVQKEDGRTGIQEDYRYRGAIKYLFKDQNTILKEADNLGFNHQSMIKVAKEYHYQVCTTGEECIVFEAKKDKTGVAFKCSLYGGIQVYKGKYSGTITSPVVGGKLNVIFPRLDKNLSFQADLAISKIQGTTTFNRENSPLVEHWTNEENGIVYNRYLSYQETDCIFIPLQLGIKYFFGNAKVRPTLAGGVLVASSIKRNNKIKYTNQIPEGDTTLKPESSLIDGDTDPVTTARPYGALGLEYSLNEKYALFFNIEGTPSSTLKLLQFKIGLSF